MIVVNEIEMIRKLDFFEALDQKVIKNIAKMCIAREFSAGDHIVKQGESGLGLYFITRGKAKVEIDRNGAKATVAELQEGDFLGELSMIDDQVRSADVICMEDTSCMLLTRDSFSKILNKHPEIALQMAKSLVARIRATNERVGVAPLQAPTPFAADPAPQSPPASLAAESASENGSSGSDFDPMKLLASTKEKAEDVYKLYSSTKNKTKEFLVELFGPIYLMKMMTQYSTAIMGCPVRVRPEARRQEVLQTTIDGVKLALLPASSKQVLRIEAFDDGEFSLTVFCPAKGGSIQEASVSRFEGRVRRNETLRLHVPANNPTWLESPPLGHEQLPPMDVHVLHPQASAWRELPLSDKPTA
jgi:CRP-like cAMP-binding protein